MKAPLCILSPPGGPAGPFWGVVLQNGRVLATQIVAREDANLLCVIHNVLASDPVTLEKIRDQTKDVRDLLDDREGTSSDHFITRSIIKAIWEVACDENV